MFGGRWRCVCSDSYAVRQCCLSCPNVTANEHSWTHPGSRLAACWTSATAQQEHERRSVHAQIRLAASNSASISAAVNPSPAARLVTSGELRSITVAYSHSICAAVRCAGSGIAVRAADTASSLPICNSARRAWRGVTCWGTWGGSGSAGSGALP